MPLLSQAKGLHFIKPLILFDLPVFLNNAIDDTFLNIFSISQPESLIYTLFISLRYILLYLPSFLFPFLAIYYFQFLQNRFPFVFKENKIKKYGIVFDLDFYLEHDRYYKYNNVLEGRLKEIIAEYSERAEKILDRNIYYFAKSFLIPIEDLSQIKYLEIDPKRKKTKFFFEKRQPKTFFLIPYPEITKISDNIERWSWEEGSFVGYLYRTIYLPTKYAEVAIENWRPEWILSEKNAQVRQVLISEIGWNKIIEELKLRSIDSWREYELFSISGVEDNEKIKLLKMICPSTGETYINRVPPEIDLAKDAIKWSNHDIDSESFVLET